jgi:hemoglobin-like flavoprotein
MVKATTLLGGGHWRGRALSTIKEPIAAPADDLPPSTRRGVVSDPYSDLQQSYGRCLHGKGFIERFYEVFMASNTEVAAMFARTDFQKQRLALRRGISVAIFHAAGSGVVKRSMEQMAAVHSQGGRCPVAPHLYPYWIDSLITVIAETDEQADEALLARWREAMDVAIGTFVQGYRTVQ